MYFIYLKLRFQQHHNTYRTVKKHTEFKKRAHKGTVSIVREQCKNKKYNNIIKIITKLQDDIARWILQGNSY